jgi:hypothetical protein
VKILASSSYKISQPGPRKTSLDASPTPSDLRGQKSSTNIHHIDRRSEEETEPQKSTCWQVANRDPVTHRHIRAGKQEDKRNTTQNTLDDQTKHFIEQNIYRKYTSFPSRVSPKEENVYYIMLKRKEITRED